MIPRASLLIFLKHPTPGRVKTRLAFDLGADEAARVYRNLAERQIREAVSLTGTSILAFYDPPEMLAAVRDWLSPWVSSLGLISQSSGDLGERMSAAFEHVLPGSSGPAVVIGTDCPRLDSILLQNAFEILSRSEPPDLVLGPAVDGGYYLLGMRRLHRSLFSNIAWSTPAVLEQTLSAASAAGLTYELLPVLGDVDTAADLALLEEEI